MHEPAEYTAERHPESIANRTTEPLKKKLTPVDPAKREADRLSHITKVNEIDAKREQGMLKAKAAAEAASNAVSEEVIYKQDLREAYKDDDAEKIKTRDRIAESQSWSDDYDYDCIVVVNGHSFIQYYEITEKLPVPDRCEQVTIMLTDPGDRCIIAGETPIPNTREVIGQPPSVILGHLNRNLKDRPQRTSDQEIQDTFLDSYKFTSGLISDDKKHYFNRSWDFFDTDKTGKKTIGNSFLYVFRRDGSEYYIYKDRAFSMRKSELLIKLQDDGLFKPLIIDCGCAEFTSERATVTWKLMIDASVKRSGKKTLGFGGKKRKTKRQMRRRKLCL